MHIHPDVQFDFRDMPFSDDTFYHVIFDPPHLIRAVHVIGWRLNTASSALTGTDLRKGFAEYFRVLKPNGTLVFKWNEVQIPLKDILALTDELPLYGHRAGRLNRTHWVVFMKSL